ncbi:MAG TPA: hypothetical protein P5137_18280 [Candidatus Brocadiia bacterium]|nr:hypothetical protein [Candidatus Brocadiia bacterium]
MSPSASAPAETAKAAGPQLSARQAKMLLAALAVYVLALAFLTADQVFEWGIVRPELDRQILARIDRFRAPPPGVPFDGLAALRGDVASLASGAPREFLPLLVRLDDAIQLFLIGAPPDRESLVEADKELEAIQKMQATPEVKALAEKAAGLLARLRGLAEGIPPDQMKALAEYRDGVIEFVINYHEFSIPLLIPALESKSAQTAAAATVCLHQIAWRFFRQRLNAGADPAAWREWWRKTNEEMDRRAQR